MRLILALGGALVLAGCATSKERVTLLDPAETPGSANSEMGSVVVIHGDGETTPITMANQQAQLRGDRPPTVRQLSARSDVHSDVMAGLPLPVAAQSFTFARNTEALDSEELGKLQTFLQAYLVSYCVYYRGLSASECEDPDLPPAEADLPEFRVIIEGFTDSAGLPETPDDVLEQRNQDLSQDRANGVRDQVLALVQQAGIPITAAQISARGNGQYAALRKHNGRRVDDSEFRVVSVTVR
ncbi:hypothetical protein NAP1_08692 [Erythrobacter sp. NAP1]|uniref:OmpA family protein n=1 Tax=Erythrobacter sp. NAP1 TaxID=237727 RepID=UPI0000685253|nr:OmpA family protein [Erythrobacter sp. NAP1]EAQ27657.1 hypothetical protein NAP1_08692 [Erythrobacter sp. NAP1]